MGLEDRLSDNVYPTCFEFEAGSDLALSPGQVRGIILRQHERIRGLLRNIEAKATHLLAMPVASAREREATRKLALVLCSFMVTHIEFENGILVTALEGVDAWGPVRAAQLRAEHAEQLEFLRAYTHALEQESSSGAALALTAWQLVEIIRQDMEEEEASVLNSDLLTDEAIGSDVETG